MERRTFFGTCAAMLGLPWLVEPVRPMRSKPYMEEGRPEYEEPPVGWTTTSVASYWLVDPDGNVVQLSELG